MSLTDAQCARIEPLLPDRSPRRGGRWRDHRQVLDAIAFKYRTGTPWVDLPNHFGSWKGVHNRLRTWAADHLGESVHLPAGPSGYFGRLGLGRRGRLHHRPRISARPGPPEGAPGGEPDDHALGRSRGGLTTNAHLAADSRCRPLACVLTVGQAGDAPAFESLMARIRVPRPVGRPRTTPDVVLADIARVPRSPAVSGDPGGDPATGRPSRQSQAQKQPRRPASSFRPRVARMSVSSPCHAGDEALTVPWMRAGISEVASSSGCSSGP
ncbi:IS5 family transposase [Streptomyces sp. NPDC059499]|uniref:IS5 family transposase n=1 Tax=Streptomyces sp. NPDC059499 TaxID=3346852 RepID=UPI0036C5EEC6